MTKDQSPSVMVWQVTYNTDKTLLCKGASYSEAVEDLLKNHAGFGNWSGYMPIGTRSEVVRGIDIRSIESIKQIGYLKLKP